MYCRLRSFRDEAADVAGADDGTEQRNAQDDAEENSVCPVSSTTLRLAVRTLRILCSVVNKYLKSQRQSQGQVCDLQGKAQI